MSLPNIYNEDNIRTLEAREAIRTKPSMYIGEIYEPGIYKIDSEIFQNAMDEYFVGCAENCWITLDTNTNIMVIEDDGRGVPIGKAVEIFTVLHTGGKFDRNAYSRSSGTHGIGAKTAVYLSKWLNIDIYRTAEEDGEARHCRIEFVDGILSKNEITKSDRPNYSGTRIEYLIDSDILKTSNRDLHKWEDYINVSSYINAGLKIHYTLNGKYKLYCQPNGLDQFFADVVKERKVKLIINKLYVNGQSADGKFDFNIHFAYSASNSGDSNINSFVNGNRTSRHGYHVSSFKTGLALAVTQYISQTDCIPKSLSKLRITGAIISDNVFGIVELRHDAAIFDSQTKDCFKNQDVIDLIRETTKTFFLKWLHDNPQQAKKLVDLAIDYAKYEDERKKLKENIIKTKETKNAFAANGIDPSKFSDCRSNNPEECELFIVEGDSAGGSASTVMNRQYQALYKLTGKTLNVVKSSPKDFSKVTLELIKVLRVGMPNQKNIKNLKYHKIILLTDADDDGAHIQTLLLAFLYTYYKEIIELGYVYIAQPPIKSINTGKSTVYIHTEGDYQRLFHNFIINSFTLHSEKTKKQISEGAFRIFLKACEGYDVLLENHAKSLAIDPNLLELIIIYINDLIAGKFWLFERYSFKVSRIGNCFNFDKGFDHTFLNIDDNFINIVYSELFEKLKTIHIYGIYIKGIRSGQEYHGTIYQLMSIMNSVLGSKISIKRYKGNGELNPPELWEMAMNPETRMLTHVTMEDAAKAERSVRVFMGNDDPEFKAKYFAGEVEFD